MRSDDIRLNTTDPGMLGLPNPPSAKIATGDPGEPGSTPRASRCPSLLAPRPPSGHSLPLPSRLPAPLLLPRQPRWARRLVCTMAATSPAAAAARACRHSPLRPGRPGAVTAANPRWLQPEGEPGAGPAPGEGARGSGGWLVLAGGGGEGGRLQGPAGSGGGRGSRGGGWPGAGRWLGEARLLLLLCAPGNGLRRQGAGAGV
ncbi:hypothetical protein V8C86DRAFT_2935149 [Haematococcus lacustris]